ncbi:hypothetical protein [Leptolyngbya sp. FACHB-17]|uniref:hypothetical protein n=2 Tax=unclassified Leptolyngbya TaxID=2650499 RepID=UPI0016805279|nr:hypothetical protein [Leptolyngbya sp. FACHB-17]
MEEIDFLMNSEPAIAPMTIEAWLILAFQVGLVAWGLMGERRDSSVEGVIALNSSIEAKIL